MAEPIFDDPDDLRAIQELLLAGEELEAVYRVGGEPEVPESRDYPATKHPTLVGITTNRIILRETTAGRHRDTRQVFRHHQYESVPYRRIFHSKMTGNNFHDNDAQTAIQSGSFSILILIESHTGSPYRWVNILSGDNARQAHDLVTAHVLGIQALGR